MSGERVGFVGGEPTTASGLEYTSVSGSAAEVLAGDPAVVVADGDDALVDLVREGVDAPVIPVATGPGIRSVPEERLATVLDRFVGGGDVDRQSYQLLEMATPDGAVEVLFDVLLVAAEPARISEYAVHWTDQQVARFRADGVLASTPAGSAGYNARADGPVIAPGTGVVAIVPIAPFTTDSDRWVLPPDGISLTIEREEPPIDVVADGRVVAGLSNGDTIALSTGGDFETVVTPESETFF